MKDCNLYLGLDVHAETITAVAVDGEGNERQLGVFANRRSSLEKLLEKVGPKKRIRAVYEAGPTGYKLYWELSYLGVECQVAAPTLTPKKPGERVKTDRRDARKLARYHRSHSFVGGGPSDSKVAHIQSGYEFTLSATMSALAGANIVFGSGVLEQGLTIDYAKIIMDAEMIRMIQIAIKGIELTDEKLAMDVIHEVGPGGA